MISKCAAEVDAWREVKDGWRPLYGDVDQFGVAVEWHDFRTERSFDWGRRCHPPSLEFCLNLQGHGAVGAVGRRQSDYVPGDSGYYAVGDEKLTTSRRAHDHHQFVTLEFSRKHLQKQLVQNESDLEPEIRHVIFGDKNENVIAPVLFFFQAEDGIRDVAVTGVQTCALPISNFVLVSLKSRSTSAGLETSALTATASPPIPLISATTPSASSTLLR